MVSKIKNRFPDTEVIDTSIATAAGLDQLQVFTGQARG